MEEICGEKTQHDIEHACAEIFHRVSDRDSDISVWCFFKWN